MLQVQEIELEKLHPWENNPRVNDHAVDSVVKSISSFGFNVPIICDQNTTIIAGHTRWKAAQKLGLRKIPVIVIEMTDSQRRAFAIADNKTAEISDWDFPRLREVLEELRSEDIDIESLGFTDEEMKEFLEPSFSGNTMDSQISKGYVEGISEIDALKLAYRLESICHCHNRKLVLDLFSGKGRLAFWYTRLFERVVRVDKTKYDGIEYNETAANFLHKHLSDYMNFDLIDFDDEGCPGKELQLFFSLIEKNKKTPFILCLTDGMGLALKLRAKVNLFQYYLFGQDKIIKIHDNIPYRKFDCYLKHLIDELCNRHGFENKLLNWHRGTDGNVVYAGFSVVPLDNT